MSLSLEEDLDAEIRRLKRELELWQKHFGEELVISADGLINASEFIKQKMNV